MGVVGTVCATTGNPGVHKPCRRQIRPAPPYRVQYPRRRHPVHRWTLGTRHRQRRICPFYVLRDGYRRALGTEAPDFAGLDDFRGQWFHTARWPAEGVDFTGKRVAVIGTGSTGIQVIPKVAEEAEHLLVLQRTPNFTVPARNRRLSEDELRSIKSDYNTRRDQARRAPSGMPPSVVPEPGKNLTDEERIRVLERGWTVGGAPAMLRSFTDAMSDLEVNAAVGDFVRSKIAEIVDDPETAAALSPTDYPFGAKRLCADTDYFATYNRANVDLIDLRRSPLECITATGVRCGGVEHAVDIIVFAIGFDAISGAVAEIDIRGRDDQTLREYWKEGPKAALGLQVAGFPNFFLVNGPGSPAVLGNVVAFAEQHVEWITDCIDYVRRNDVATIESTDDFDEHWAQHVDEVAATTLYVKAKSWYTGDNIPGKPSRFLPYAAGLDQYRDKCDDIAADGYQPFVLNNIGAAAATVAG